MNIESDASFENEQLIKSVWLIEQDIIKSKITVEDQRDFSNIKNLLVGGLDISFIVGDNVNACACYVVLDAQSNIVYNTTKMVQMDSPYIPGFLAFREAKFLVQLVREQIENEPSLKPDILMIDGNGILHPNQAGIASHLGVELKIPTIGVAKNLHLIEALGKIDRKEIVEHLRTKGSRFDLRSESSNEILGCALKTCDAGQNPVFISVGTGISLDSAVKVVLHYSKHRIPEPTRQADIISREYLRIHHPTERQKQPVKKSKQKSCQISNDSDF